MFAKLTVCACAVFMAGTDAEKANPEAKQEAKPEAKQGELIPIEKNIIHFTNLAREKYQLPPLEPDPKQQREVMTHEYKAAVAKYQREIGHQDGGGKIDFRTLSAAAGGNMSLYLFERIPGAEKTPEKKAPVKKTAEKKPVEKKAPAVDDAPTTPPAANE